jgi:HAD superfamily hydrolase (TIGR01509 family)
MLKAVIFDLDGVVADSHPIHETAWKTLLIEEGLDPVTLSLDFLYAGHPRREILRHYFGHLEPSDIERMGRRKDELYAVAAKGLKTKPGILRVLSQLNAEGILCAVATSAQRVRTHEALEKFAIKGCFSAIVAGEDVSSPKPAPDIFLLAAGKLGVLAKNAVVVEDSVAGIQAARAAGMKCVGYALPRFVAALRDAGADDVISDLPANATHYFRKLVGGHEVPATQSDAGHARG